MDVLDHDSVVPLYEQAIELIRQDILQGRLTAKQRLPSESEYAAQYGISIITIRRAISELVKEGLVEKKQGKGTFVAGPKYVKSFEPRPKSFTEMCEANGIQASSRLLDAGITVPPKEVLEALHLSPGSEAVRILRLRLADQTPCVIEENYFPKKYDSLLALDLGAVSIYKYLREEQGLEIVPGRMALKIIRADAKTAKLLEIERKTPILEMESLAHLPTGEVLHTCKQFGYGEDFSFVVR